MTPTTNVIILAQGNQRRLGDAVKVPKCLLRLPACGDVPILNRTLVQVWKLLGGVGLDDPGLGYNGHRVHVVGWHEVREHFIWNQVKIPPTSSNPFSFIPEVTSLADPGNSSLKGVSRFLAQQAAGRHPNARLPERTIVLLGDVVYSWRCLDALFSTVGESNMMFAGTHDLGPGGGELWGIRWDRSADTLMMGCLERALAKHPKFEEYQPGQLRNWLWEVDRALPALVDGGNRDWYYATLPTDYMMDVDLPEHVPLLAGASSRSAADDRDHGVFW